MDAKQLARAVEIASEAAKAAAEVGRELSAQQSVTGYLRACLCAGFSAGDPHELCQAAQPQ